MRNSAEHEIFSADIYENSWKQFHAHLCLARKEMKLLVIWDLLAWQISCSVQLNMKTVLYKYSRGLTTRTVSCFKGKQKTITKTRLFKYIENFYSKNEKFSDDKLWYFSHFCSKHRLWVLDKAVLTSTHNLCIWAEIRKIMYTPVNPVLLYKSGG